MNKSPAGNRVDNIFFCYYELSQYSSWPFLSKLLAFSVQGSILSLNVISFFLIGSRFPRFPYLFLCIWQTFPYIDNLIWILSPPAKISRLWELDNFLLRVYFCFLKSDFKKKWFEVAFCSMCIYIHKLYCLAEN